MQTWKPREPGEQEAPARPAPLGQEIIRGVSLRTVSQRLGHADPGFTLSTYTHGVPGTQQAAAQAIGEEVFGARRT
jgi:hypothetical protein